MSSSDRRPERIDLGAILSSETSGDDSIELLDPVTGVSMEPDRAEGAKVDSAALLAAEAEKEKYQDLWVRARADFENLRKRTEREREEERVQSGSALVRDLLPALDNLDRALAALPESDSFRTGIALIRRQVGDALGRSGLSPIEASGQPFNPLFHEAVLTEKTGSLPPNHVTEEIQKGYTFHGRVMRPSLVKVSVAADEDQAEVTESESTA